jgi:hypothetical protein
MAFHERRTWTGVIRGEMTSIKRRLNSMLRYNTRHPDRAFLSDADVIIINSVITNVINVKLAQTVLR